MSKRQRVLRRILNLFERDPNLMDTETRNRVRKRRIRFWLVLAVVFVFVTGYQIYSRNRTFSKYEVISTIDLGEEHNSYFTKFGDYFLKYSNDGAAYMGQSESIWNKAFEFDNPIADVNGDYAAVADQGANSIFLFNTEKEVGEVTMPYPIKKVSVAKKGVVAAILEDTNDSYIEIRDKENQVISSGKTALEETGYPIDLAISDDGKKLAVSYVSIDGGKSSSKLMFYNFGEVGQSEVDNLVGAYELNDTILPKMEFLNNDLLVAYGDDKLMLYKIKEKPEKIWEEKTEGEISKVFYNDKYFGLVYYRGSEKKPFEIAVYNLKGVRMAEYKYTKSYDSVFLDGKNVVLYNEGSFALVSFSGKEKYQGQLSSTARAILPTGKEYRYLVLYEDRAEKIKMK